MNSETLISQAGYAIDMYKIDHRSACCLCIKDGLVRAVPVREASFQVPGALVITLYEQQQGLTSKRWSQIGASLLRFYFKENACQIPPKP